MLKRWAEYVEDLYNEKDRLSKIISGDSHYTKVNIDKEEVKRARVNT